MRSHPCSWLAILRAQSVSRPSSLLQQTSKRCSFPEPSTCPRCCTLCLASPLKWWSATRTSIHFRCLLHARASTRRCAAKSTTSSSSATKAAALNSSLQPRLPHKTNIASEETTPKGMILQTIYLLESFKGRAEDLLFASGNRACSLSLRSL